jgi:hypothetical protein
MKINPNINLFTTVAFSKSKAIDNLQHVIASVQFRDSYKDNEINFDLIQERLKILNCRKIIFVNIKNNNNSTLTHKIYGDKLNTYILVINISSNIYFTKETLVKLVLTDRDMAKYMIFHFESKP